VWKESGRAATRNIFEPGVYAAPVAQAFACGDAGQFLQFAAISRAPTVVFSVFNLRRNTFIASLPVINIWAKSWRTSPWAEPW